MNDDFNADEPVDEPVAEPVAEFSADQITQMELNLSNAETAVAGLVASLEAAVETHKNAVMETAHRLTEWKAFSSSEHTTEEQLARAVSDLEEAKAVEAQAKETIASVKQSQKDGKAYIKNTKAAIKSAKADLKKSQKQPKPEKAPKVERVRQNGVVYPREGSTCWKCWQIFDRMAKETGLYPVLSEAVTIGAGMGINSNTVRTQFHHWRNFYGLESQRVTAAAAKVVAEAAAKAAAEAAAKAAAEAAAPQVEEFSSES